MFDTETKAILRSVLDEVCKPSHGSGAKAYVALKLLEAAARGPATVEELKQTGKEALKRAPVTWR